MKATASPGETQGGFSGIAAKVAIGGGGPAGSGRRRGHPRHILEAPFGGGEGRHAACGHLAYVSSWLLLTHTPPFVLSAYARRVPVIMVMCPFEIGSRLPSPAVLITDS